MPDAAARLNTGKSPERPVRPTGPGFFLYAVSIATALLIILPLAYLVLRAAGADGAVTELLWRPRTWEILKRSLVLAFSVTFLSTLISLPLAWALERTDLPFKRMWAVLTTVPIVIPSYVGGFVAVSALGPRGLLQQALEPLGVDRLPEIYGLSGAVITLTLLRFPYMLIPVRASLANLDPSLEESSRSLGKGSLETFLKVILPQLRPAVAGGCLLTAMTALGDFGAVSLLRYETFTWAIYLQYQSVFDRTAAAALSLVLAALALGLLAMEGRTRAGASFYRMGHGKRPPLRPLNLGRWKVPALALFSLLALGSLLMPVFILLMWLVRGMAAGEHFPGLPAAMVNSLCISAAAAVIIMGAAFPIAYLSARSPGRLIYVLERVAYFGFALPGVVVALALVFFGIRFIGPLYQTHALLVAAYVILFLPVALGPLRAVLLQQSPRLEEAAHSLGRSQSYALTRVIIPLARPGILAGAALAFLVTMRELPATLILSPIGFRTLATSVWSASSEAFFARAAADSLVLIAVSSVPMAILIIKERSRREV